MKRSLSSICLYFITICAYVFGEIDETESFDEIAPVIEIETLKK